MNRGHVAEINACAWHPKDVDSFMTASNDSTIRIWNAEKLDKSKSIIVVKSKERGQRTRITACAWSGDGRMVAAAGYDGAIHIWNTSSNYVRPNHVCRSFFQMRLILIVSKSVEGAHEKGTTTSGLTFSLDNHTLVSRGCDGTVKRKWLNIRSLTFLTSAQ